MKNIALPLVMSTVLIGYTMPLQAKSTIGGIVFLNSYYQEQDAARSGGRDDVSKTKIEVPNNSRIRIRWDNEDRVGMYTEMGIGDDVTLRHAYGTWDSSEKWQLLAGKTTTPFAPLNPEVAMVHNSGQSVGNTQTKREAQLRLTRKFLNRRGAIAVALLDPNQGDEPQDAIAANSNLGSKDTALPRIDIGAAYRAFNMQLFPSVFYQRQSYNNLTSLGSDDDVTSWGAAFGAKTALGPLTIAAEIGYGQNWGNSQMSLSGSPAGDNASAVPYARNGVTKLADTDNLAFWIDAGYRFTSSELKGTVHLVLGTMNSEADGPSGSSADTDYESTMIGLSVPTDLPWIARGFRFRPELFYFDYGKNDVGNTEVDGGDEIIAGVQLQYTF